MRAVRTLAAIALAVLPAGCVSLSEAERAERDYRRQDYEAKFLDFRQQCYTNGGRIVIDATGSLDRRGVPKRGSHYRCGRRY